MLRFAARACALTCLIFCVILASVVPLASADAKPVVEVAFVLDTTGSMGPLIESANARSGRSPPRSSIAARELISQLSALLSQSS